MRSLRIRLALLIILAVLTVYTLAVGIVFHEARQAALSANAQRLTDMRDTLKIRIEERFRQAEDDLALTASGLTAMNAVQEFEEAAYLLNPSLDKAAQILRETYISKNPRPPGDSLYSQIHARRHPFFYSLAKKKGLADILISEPVKGFILYSAGKDDLFGRSALEEPLKNAAVGSSFELAVKDGAARPAWVISHEENERAYSAFISAPIKSRDTIIGVLTFRVDDSLVSGILRRFATVNEGFSASMVAGDREFATSGDVIKKPSGEDTVLSASSPLVINGVESALFVETKKEDALAALEELKANIVFGAGVALLAAVLIFYAVSSPIFPKLDELTRAMKTVSKEGTGSVSLAARGSNELSALFAAFDDLRRKTADREHELETKAASLMRYIDNIEKSEAPKKPEPSGKEKLFELQAKESARLAELARARKKEADRLAKELEEARRRLEEMESSRKRFGAMAESELERAGNILNRLASAMSKGAVSGDLIKNARQELEKIRSGLEALPSKPIRASGYILSAPEYIDLVGLADQAVNTARPVAESKGLKLTFESASGEITARGDRKGLGAAMRIMIESAINSFTEGGRLEVSVSASGRMARFELKIFIKGISADSGEGIEHGKESDTLRAIIEAHGGRIIADSEGAKRSYSFEIPTARRPAQGTLPGFDV